MPADITDHKPYADVAFWKPCTQGRNAQLQPSVLRMAARLAGLVRPRLTIKHVCTADCDVIRSSQLLEMRNANTLRHKSCQKPANCKQGFVKILEDQRPCIFVNKKVWYSADPSLTGTFELWT